MSGCQNNDGGNYIDMFEGEQDFFLKVIRKPPEVKFVCRPFHYLVGRPCPLLKSFISIYTAPSQIQTRSSVLISSKVEKTSKLI